MKKGTLLVILAIALLSCEGKFEPHNPITGTINLSSPLDKELCLDGEKQNDDSLDIPFTWETEDAFDQYRVEVTNSATNTRTDVTVSAKEAVVNLAPGTQYTWKVVGITNDGEVTSDQTWSFYSQGIPQFGYIPYPAKITVVDNSNNTIDLQWQTTDTDNNITGYDIYFGTDDPPPLFGENNTETLLTNIPITTGATYYINVVTKDADGNSSESKIEFLN